MTWHLALGLHAPLELVAEGQFGIGEQDRTEISVPLAKDGKLCGEASVVVRRRGPVRPPLGAFLPPGSSARTPIWADDDTRLFCESTAGLGPCWEEEEEESDGLP